MVRGPQYRSRDGERAPVEAGTVRGPLLKQGRQEGPVEAGTVRGPQ